jgi:hypothetical protein
VVPAEGTIVELESKKSLLKKNCKPAATAEQTNDKESSTEDEELTAEDVDEGDFAADIAEQPLEDLEALEGEVYD